MNFPTESADQDFLHLYGAEAWKDWQRLITHFEFGQGFSFLCLLLPGAVGADICRRQLQKHLAAKDQELLEISCNERDKVRQLANRLFALEVTPKIGGLWVGTVIPESDPEIKLWREAWQYGLAALNERRNPLIKHFSCPMVLVGAPWLQTVLREMAPDLWSIRTAVVAVTPAPESSSDNAFRGENNLLRHSTDLVTKVDETSSDPDYALEQAKRLQGKPGLEANYASLLLRAGKGFYDRVRYDTAEEVLREAVTILETIAVTSPEIQVTLASALNTLTITLSKLGQREDALTKSEQAVQIYEQLAKTRPEAFLPDLAMSLNNLSISLSELGRREEALAKIAQSVQIREQLAKARPEAFLPDLAGSLNNLSTILSELGRRKEAMAKSEQALQINEQLAKVRPEKILPDLAMSLNNLSIILRDLGRREEVLAKIEQSVQIYEQLIKARPDAFLPDLSRSLNNLSIILSDLDRHEEALAKIEQAVQIREQLAKVRPEAFLSDLARSYGIRGQIYLALKRGNDATTSFAQGIKVLTPQFQKTPMAFERLMRKLFHDYVESMKHSNQEPDQTMLEPVTAIFATLPNLQTQE